MCTSPQPCTAGKSLPHDAFVRLAAAAGFPASDPDFTFADTHSLAAMQDLFYAANSLRFGGWGIPSTSETPPARSRRRRLPQTLRRLRRRRRGADSRGTAIMPASDLPFSENWAFLVSRIKPSPPSSPTTACVSALNPSPRTTTAANSNTPSFRGPDPRTRRRLRPQCRPAGGYVPPPHRRRTDVHPRLHPQGKTRQRPHQRCPRHPRRTTARFRPPPPRPGQHRP